MSKNPEFESKHPRRDGGKFAEKPEVSAGVSLTPARTPVTITLHKQFWGEGAYRDEAFDMGSETLDVTQILAEASAEDRQNFTDAVESDSQDDLEWVFYEARKRGLTSHDGPFYLDADEVQFHPDFENGFADLAPDYSDAPSPYDQDDPYQAFLDQMPEHLFPAETRERDAAVLKDISEYNGLEAEEWEETSPNDLRTDIDRVVAVDDCPDMDRLRRSLRGVALTAAAPRWNVDSFDSVAESLDDLRRAS